MTQTATRKQIAELMKRFLNGTPEYDRELASRLLDNPAAFGTTPKVQPLRIAAEAQQRRQAMRYWRAFQGQDKKRLDAMSFEAYLAKIPNISADLIGDDEEFPLLVLVEPRLGLKRLCDLGGIRFDGNDKTLIVYDGKHREFDRPDWIRIQDGRKNRDRSVRDCRESFGKRELGLTALQGVCAYHQHPQVVSEANQDGAHVMDLPGSIHRGDGNYAACLGLRNGQPKLHWGFAVCALSDFGSASRRE